MDKKIIHYSLIVIAGVVGAVVMWGMMTVIAVVGN
jgi:hypothetical protein